MSSSNPTTRRLKLIIAYDGASFAGWQSQSHRNTIQDHLERALEHVAGRPVRVHGAGRTDAGVNALLPPTIRVLRSAFVSQNFHARLSAKGKIYRYRIWNAPVMSPFESARAWHVPQPLDLNLLAKGAKAFVGTHDFAGFAASRGKPEPSTVRTIYSTRVRKRGPCVTIEFHGDGFLYKMVRLMVGSLVKCALGKMRVEDITARLRSGDVAAARFAAPPEGLFLVKVHY
jgi:tRNA pseudouridine38-40 synthase